MPQRADRRDVRRDLALSLGVERARRLVPEQRRRPARQRAGDRHPLPLPTGERLRPGVRPVREPQALEPDPRLAFRRGLSPEARRERAVLHHPQVREQLDRLEHQAHAAEQRRRVRRGRPASVPSATRPASNVSRPARQRSSVDFPEPLAPSTTATRAGLDPEAHARRAPAVARAPTCRTSASTTRVLTAPPPDARRAAAPPSARAGRREARAAGTSRPPAARAPRWSRVAAASVP